MIKKTKLVWALAAALSAAPALAAGQSATIGYAQGKVSGGDTLRGVNAKYNYELNDRWGVIGSLTYMKGSKSGLTDSTSIAPDILANGERSTKFFSLAAGPSYRLHDKVTAYGLLGVARTKADVSADWMNHESGTYVKRGTVSANAKRTGLSYGGGVQINPTQRYLVDLSYENAPGTNGQQNKRVNSFAIGLGCRF